MKLQILPEQFAAAPTLQQKKVQRWQQMIGALIMIGCMVILLPLVLRAPRPDFLVPSTAVLVLSTFLLFPLALFISVVWHEVGHLLAGWSVGFRFVLVTFGPLRLAREAGGLRLSLIHTNVMQWQGRALLVPTEFGDFRRQRMVLMAGGPVATLLQLLLVMGVNYFLRNQAISYGFGLASLWLMLSAVMMLPATAVPQKIGHLYTDAARIWQMWRGGPQLDSQLALAHLVEASLRGVPPGDMDDAFVAAVLAAPPESNEVLGGYYVAHTQALERGKIETAAGFLDRALALLQQQPPPLRSPVIFATAAYFVARYEQNLPQAQAWLDLIRPAQYNALALEVEQIQLRARAQVLLLAGEQALAKTAALHSLKMLNQSVDLGSATYEMRLLQPILAELEDVTPAPQLPQKMQPLLSQKRPFFAASSRGVLRWAIIVVVGLLLGYFWRELFPGQAVTAYQQGVAYMEDGRMEAAIAAFNQAVALDAQFAQAYWGRGEAYMALGEYETAVADFDRVVALHPTTFPSIYIYRASAYTQLGDYPAAIADYETLLSLNPEDDLRRLAIESIHLLQTAR